jgi:Protein of unknown function (DUF1810)
MLGSRLRNDVGLMMRHKGKSALEILGSPDDLKFRSCLTLFAQAALGNSERGVFNEAARIGFTHRRLQRPKVHAVVLRSAARLMAMTAFTNISRFGPVLEAKSAALPELAWNAA